MNRDTYWQKRNRDIDGGRFHLYYLWEQYSKLIENDQTEETIDKENKLISHIESLLPFKDLQEHEHWLDVLSSYKFWEDIDDLTKEIINRLKQDEKDDLILAYEKVAKDYAFNSKFYALFNAFSRLSNGWVKPMFYWGEWARNQQENHLEEWNFFLKDYEELYGKKYNIDDIYENNYYGFETCPCAAFYKTTDKQELMECIFERYAMGLEDDECLEFFKGLIVLLMRGE